MKKIPKDWIPTIPKETEAQLDELQKAIDTKASGMTNPMLFVGIDGIWDVKDCDDDGNPLQADRGE